MVNPKNKNILGKLLVKAKFNTVSDELAKLREFISEPSYIDVSIKLESEDKNKDVLGSTNKITKEISVGAEISHTKTAGSLHGKYSKEQSDSESAERIRAYSSMLLRHFSIKDYMERISLQLQLLGINKVHVFLDDFSEIDFEAQQIFVNTILAPLNNWSEKFFRFKIGAYPKRIFYGDIEKGKISEIQLDYYDLYKVKGLPELEEKAIALLNNKQNSEMKECTFVPKLFK